MTVPVCLKCEPWVAGETRDTRTFYATLSPGGQTGIAKAHDNEPLSCEICDSRIVNSGRYAIVELHNV